MEMLRRVVAPGVRMSLKLHQVCLLGKLHFLETTNYINVLQWSPYNRATLFAKKLWPR